MEKAIDGVRQVVSELYNANGSVTPSALLEAARNEESPAHAAFEWDDTKAGHLYRLVQARTLIRKVHVIIEDQPQRMVWVPRVVILPEEVEEGADAEYLDGSRGREGSYKPMSVVVEDVEDFAAALAATLAGVNSAKASYQELKDAARKVSESRRPNFNSADTGFRMIETALQQRFN